MASKVKPKARMVPIPLKPIPDIDNCLRPTVEITGDGNLLCYEGFSGRWFRSSESQVQQAADEFSKLYAEGNYICWNDLYALLHIAVTHFGNRYGYAGNDDYRNCETLDFDITRIPADENFEGMGEEVLVIEPATEYCYPYDFYMEV